VFTEISNFLGIEVSQVTAAFGTQKFEQLINHNGISSVRLITRFQRLTF
jgi:uncharacterized protein YidB (DUF937 family)